MNSILEQFRVTAQTLKKPRVIVGVAMFCALSTALNLFRINLSADLRISFGFLAVAASCYFYGAVPNVIAALVLDVISYLISPTGFYFPGFAVTAMVQSLIYSAFFYGQKDVPLWKILTARALVMVVCNLLLNSLWLTIMYSTPFWSLFGPRLIKNVILYPAECFLLDCTLSLCQKLNRRFSQSF